MPNRPLVIAALAGGVAVVVAIGVNVVQWKDETGDGAAKKQVAAEKAGKAPATQGTPQATNKSLPSFDVVRIDPRGDAVMAGRAIPGSTVIILDAGQPIGEVIADARGEWVFVPKMPLPPGSRELSLEMRVAGKDPVTSKDVVVLVVPKRGQDVAGRDTDTPSGVLALKVGKDGGGSTVLQTPSGSGAGAISIDALDYDEQGRLHISGRAKPRAIVNVYLGNTFIGRAKTDDKGQWRLQPESPIKPGRYTLRADQVDDTGKVIARASTPFQRSAPMADAPRDPFVIVQPGNSLWRLARRSYGKGVSYTTIFEANKEQIKDPDLIYPGQVLALPQTN
ncbi:MAG: Ig-like domain-containing protein [Proteobacteria bacterium]|nr:Ig-like domain-containing protein [Pseudomonadota bacterium]MDA1023383.1 Ig-like domain-containing protein [Pseudomonadota bacterium]